MGFNALRIPFCNEALREGAAPTSINYAANPELVGLSPLQVLDEVIRYAGTIGLRIFLDRHSSKADGLLVEDIWYIPGDDYYTKQRWIDDWVMLAARYRGNPTVIGADLFNEPKRTATWAAWRLAAQECGDAIHAVNPDWLIIVEGTGEASGAGENAWWGGNLIGAAADPVVLTVPNKLVYSAHDYPSSVYNQEWFSHTNYPLNLPDHWRPFWGYLFEQNIAPIIIGEFGTFLRTTSDQQWLDKITDYMDGDFDLDGSRDLAASKKGISWTFWCLNPNSGDTGGILQDDWITPNLDKLAYIRPSMEELATSTLLLANSMPSETSSSSGLSGAEIAAIAIASLALSLITATAFYFAFRNAKAAVAPAPLSFCGLYDSSSSSMPCIAPPTSASACTEAGDKGLSLDMEHINRSRSSYHSTSPLAFLQGNPMNRVKAFFISSPQHSPTDSSHTLGAASYADTVDTVVKIA